MSGGSELTKAPAAWVGTSRLKVKLRCSKGTCWLKWLWNHMGVRASNSGGQGFKQWGSGLQTVGVRASNSGGQGFKQLLYLFFLRGRVILPFLEWPPSGREKIS